MTRAEFLDLLAHGSDDEVVDATWDFLPETESDEETGYETGDPLALISYADSEIRNGGFYQFYSNGIFDALHMPRLFQDIDAGALAQCIAEANARFPEGMPPYRGSREVEEVELEMEEMEIGEDSFKDIEERYLAASSDLAAKLAQFVRSNPDRYAPPE